MRAHELQGVLIDDGRHIGMQPQNSRRDLRHDPAAQQALCDLRLSAAVEEQQDALCLHQHTETDRNSLPRHGVRVVKVVSISLYRGSNESAVVVPDSIKFLLSCEAAL